ncbi:hypothetical protein GOBAR_AA28969 [Gossypium barbadense]|uniref:Protein kinase domain-containing protein n=1 Tax=Gossypium barbadense TaxID=3634 RepID=A0A2P5WKX2_GOSBA|nr:hypothetical protein GOBAR_AA28969 [Gossypium barbadense]
MLSPYIFNYFNYSMYSDENETYFSYSVYNSSVITRFIIDVTGHMRELVWFEESQQWMSIWSEPRQFCEVLNSCGPFSSCSEDTTSCRCLRGFYPSGKQQGQDGGCMRRVALTCGNGDNRDMFFRMNDVRYPVSSTQKINSSYNFPSGPQVSNSDAKACREACLSNCTCSAYAYNTSGLCLRWYGDILGLEQLSAKDPNGRTIFIKLAASEFDNGRGDREDPSQDILLFDMEMSITTSSSDFSGSENPRKRKRKDAPFPLFSFDSVSLATDNFSSENKLGEGGFGPVYKGKLLNGQEIAVKRLSKWSGQGLEELKNETMLIAKLQHRNLVRLLGCCLEQGEKILIYEFMPNKSLDSFLFGSNSEGLLDWGTRVRIIEGIAQGMLALRQFANMFRQSANLVVSRSLVPVPLLNFHKLVEVKGNDLIDCDQIRLQAGRRKT